MKSVTLGAISFGLIFGLATVVIAANPQQINQLRQTNQCPGCDLRSIPLQQASLANADLQRADLRGSNLREANLAGANLSGASLSGASLRQANLAGADLTEANLTGADLTGANLENSARCLYVIAKNYAANVIKLQD